jgi:hypothetical protein
LPVEVKNARLSCGGTTRVSYSRTGNSVLLRADESYIHPQL